MLSLPGQPGVFPTSDMVNSHQGVWFNVTHLSNTRTPPRLGSPQTSTTHPHVSTEYREFLQGADRQGVSPPGASPGHRSACDGTAGFSPVLEGCRAPSYDSRTATVPPLPKCQTPTDFTTLQQIHLNLSLP